MNKFKEYWKSETFKFSVKITLEGGIVERADVRVVSSDVNEAKQDVLDATKREFRYNDVKNIEITQL
jgi:hypothetical protein